MERNKISSFGIIAGAVAIGVVIGGVVLLYGPVLIQHAYQSATFGSGDMKTAGYSDAICSTEFAAEMIVEHTAANNDGLSTSQRIEQFNCKKASGIEFELTEKHGDVWVGKAKLRSGGVGTFYFAKLPCCSY